MKQVSIIVPVYNAERFIKETLSAISQQTYKNIEVICVDDGSKDKSREVIEEFIKTDNRIKYIYQENAGAPAARNNGFRNSTSEYVIYFDADDLMERNSIESMVLAMEENDADLVIGSFVTMSGDQLIEHRYRNETIVLSDETIFDVAGKDPLPCNKLYRRSVIEAANIEFDPLRLAQDLNFFIKFLLNAKTVSFTSDNVMKYRIVENSISHTYTLKILEIENSFKKIEEYAATIQKDIQKEKWYLLVKLLHFTHQYTKIPYLKTYGERKKAIEYFERNVSQLKDEAKLSDKEFSEVSNGFDLRRRVYKIIKYPVLSDLFLLVKQLRR